MKAPTSYLTKIITLTILALLGWGGIALAGLIIPSPYHYAAFFWPILLLYLIGLIASKNETTNKNSR